MCNSCAEYYTGFKSEVQHLCTVVMRYKNNSCYNNGVFKYIHSLSYSLYKHSLSTAHSLLATH